MGCCLRSCSALCSLPQAIAGVGIDWTFAGEAVEYGGLLVRATAVGVSLGGMLVTALMLGIVSGALGRDSHEMHVHDSNMHIRALKACSFP